MTTPDDLVAQGRQASLPQAAFAAALAHLPNMTPVRLRAMLESGSPRSAWVSILDSPTGESVPLETAPSRDDSQGSHHSGERRSVPKANPCRAWAVAARGTDVGSLWRRYRNRQIRVDYLGDADFPASFASDPEGPAVVFSRAGGEIREAIQDLGRLPTPRVAIVGTRSASRGGRDVAQELGAGLTAAGVSVVSGLAHGIDAAAHRGALATSGAAPIAVVGSGLDVVYPPSSRDLWRKMGEKGVLMTEYSLGSPPHHWHFPARNRIIAALSDLVVVVESHDTGGAMHTVEAAARLGVEVLAVPGSVRARSSEGTNRLLHEGCSVARDTVDVLVALSCRVQAERSARSRDLRFQGQSEVGRIAVDDAVRSLGGTEREVLDVLDWSPTPTSEIVERCEHLSIGVVTLALDGLETAKLVRRGAGWWERI